MNSYIRKIKTQWLVNELGVPFKCPMIFQAILYLKSPKTIEKGSNSSNRKV